VKRDDLEREREAWEADIERRQHNFVFPDTVQNEGRFYRNILRTKMPLNPVQRAGVFGLGILSLLSGIGLTGTTIAALGGNGDSRLSAILMSAFSILSLVLGWKLCRRALADRKATRHHKRKDLQHPDKY
jgi:hypothetical protein